MSLSENTGIFFLQSWKLFDNLFLKKHGAVKVHGMKCVITLKNGKTHRAESSVFRCGYPVCFSHVERIRF